MLIVCLSFLLFLAIVMFSIALGVVVLRAQERKRVRGFLAQLDEQPVAVVAAGPSSVELRPKGRIAVPRELAISCCAFGLAGAVAGWFLPVPLGSLLLGAVAAAVPVLRVRRRRAARIAAFEAQFPDALEFLSRSMLAGHGFSTSLTLLVEESPEPLAGVFRMASNEIQLGAPLDRALGKISEEIPLLDVRFFVSAVLLQQASGGNLADILNKLAIVVRERFRLSGEVRSASAHGRLTSMVLIALPVLLTVALLVMDPEYLVTFAHEPEGRFLLIFAVCGQLAGHTIIQRIVNIKV
jgi:tight adherence protein B